jgi:hypothetical protein
MKKNLPFILIGLVLIILAFYGGMKLGQGNGSKRGFGNFQNLTPEQQQQMTQRFGNGIGRNVGNANTGEIIAKDSQSITIKLRDGGSKIIFFSGSTKISKSTDGVSDDLAVGANVMVDGTVNQDGSLTAQTIRINNLPPVINPLTNQPKS